MIGIRAGGDGLRRQPLLAVLTAFAAATALMGCGDGGSTETATSAVDFGKGPSARISTGTPDSRTSEVLVSERGYTLYVFDEDVPDSGKSACYGPCERQWRPLATVGPPEVWEEARLASRLLGAIERKDGRLQVTYDGRPLYLASGNLSLGSAGAGEKAFGGEWLLIQPGGQLSR
jgi:predicted lipoprotein with Yx(FWY)xxD motif